MSSRNATVTGPGPDEVEERILDAATRLLAASARQPGIAEIARQAGVSRPTVYRRFADGDAVVKALWNREITRVLDAAAPVDDSLEALVTLIVDVAEHVSTDDTLTATYRADPLLMARYITERLGTGQQVLLDLVRVRIAASQQVGTVRAGNAGELAAMTLLITQSAVQSRRMIAEHLTAHAWRRELTHALIGYLSP